MGPRKLWQTGSWYDSNIFFKAGGGSLFGLLGSHNGMWECSWVTRGKATDLDNHQSKGISEAERA